MRWTLCYVRMINSKQTVPNASIHVNGMNSNSYHFKMSPLKHLSTEPGMALALEMCGAPLSIEQTSVHMQAHQRIPL